MRNEFFFRLTIGKSVDHFHHSGAVRSRLGDFENRRHDSHNDLGRKKKFFPRSISQSSDISMKFAHFSKRRA